MYKYVDDKGWRALDEKLLKRYGETVNFDPGRQTRATEKPRMKRGKKSQVNSPNSNFGSDSSNVGLSRKDKEMLELYFQKFDPRYLNGNYMEEIYEHAEKYGMEVLNYQLKKKYLQNLDEFTLEGQKLHNDMYEFYRGIHNGNITPELDRKIEKELFYGVINGREEVNKNLMKKYGKDLSSVDVRARRKESYKPSW